MQIQDIYIQYTIMPSLQLHMLRVAAVAQLICNSFEKELSEKIPNQVRDDNIHIDTEHIIAACLLHDMGNILKFNMAIFPEFLEPEGKEYWENIKKEYTQKYGTDEHEATIQIAKEIQMAPRIIQLIDRFYFLKAQENEKIDDYGAKICAYADMRVEPHHIVSLKGRLEEGKRRFYQNTPQLFDNAVFQTMTASLGEIEKQIFSKITIKPTDITDATVSPFIENLRNFELSISK
ncbi:MAG TPA: HD domain-containing protein [Candidatus Woesebacteria bacterium]|nr:HD domain-containing protein [Candidatus Woesebacteria bacterium]